MTETMSGSHPHEEASGHRAASSQKYIGDAIISACRPFTRMTRSERSGPPIVPSVYDSPVSSSTRADALAFTDSIPFLAASLVL